MTNPSSADELAPCPFCGGTEIFVEPDESGSGGQWVGPVHVGCTACKCEQMADEEDEAIAKWNRRASLGEAQVPAHPDDEAVDRFAAAMKGKLAAARAKGRGGWQDPDCKQERLSQMLREHVEKGDPRDVANFCMFLHQRGEAISAGAAQVPSLSDAVSREDFDKFVGDLTRAKNLLVRLYDKHPEARAQIAASTGSWFVWGVDRDSYALSQPSHHNKEEK